MYLLEMCISVFYGLQFLGSLMTLKPWVLGFGFWTEVLQLLSWAANVLSLLDLVRVTNMRPFSVLLWPWVSAGKNYGRGWQLAFLCLINSVIFFFSDGKGVISVPQGLYLLTWETPGLLICADSS